MVGVRGGGGGESEGGRAGGGEARDRQTHRETQRERHTQTETQTDRQTHTDRDTDRQTHKETERERDTDRDTDTERSLDSLSWFFAKRYLRKFLRPLYSSAGPVEELTFNTCPYSDATANVVSVCLGCRVFRHKSVVVFFSFFLSL